MGEMDAGCGREMCTCIHACVCTYERVVEGLRGGLSDWDGAYWRCGRECWACGRVGLGGGVVE